ncbi:MAG: DUF177 domain-containing protein [Pseudomonadota bacterium]
MSEPLFPPNAIRVSDLPRQQAHSFALQLSPDVLASLAEQWQLKSLRKVSFSGQIRAEGRTDWRLTGHLGATVVQPCVVTLDPVSTRIETDVTRLYTPLYTEPDTLEAEMPADDTIEPLGRWIDPQAVLEETLALALPLYPRKDPTRTGDMVYAEPGVTPMRDEDARPFASLAELREKLAGEKKTQSDD